MGSISFYIAHVWPSEDIANTALQTLNLTVFQEIFVPFYKCRNEKEWNQVSLNEKKGFVTEVKMGNQFSLFWGTVQSTIL